MNYIVCGPRWAENSCRTKKFVQFLTGPFAFITSHAWFLFSPPAKCKSHTPLFPLSELSEGGSRKEISNTVVGQLQKSWRGVRSPGERRLRGQPVAPARPCRPPPPARTPQTRRPGGGREEAAVLAGQRAAGLPVRAQGLREAPAALRPQFPSDPFPCKEGSPTQVLTKRKRGAARSYA